MTIEDFIERLDKPERCGKGWKALCPAHEDNKASLGVSEGNDGRLLVKCFAGCTAEEIVAAMALPMSALFNNESGNPGKQDRRKKNKATSNPKSVDWQACVLAMTDHYVEAVARKRGFSIEFMRELRDSRQIGIHNGLVAFPVENNGKIIGAHVRLNDGNWFHEPSGINAAPMIFGELVAGEPVHYFESTWDALAFMYVTGERSGIVCTRGAANYTFANVIPERCTVFAWKQNDEPKKGKCAGDEWLKNSFEYTYPSCTIKVPPIPAHDFNDWTRAGATTDDIQAAIKNAKVILEAQSNEPGEATTESSSAESKKSKPSKKDKRKKQSAASRLVAFVTDSGRHDANGKGVGPFKLFHDLHDRAFARYQALDHVEVWSVESAKFKKLLARLYYKNTGQIINRNSLSDAVTALAGLAVHENPQEETFLRVAPYGDDILIDLCDPMWRVVLVTAEGWQVLELSPVAFVRTGSMLPLPEPRPGGGSIKPLWDLLNVTKEQQPLITGAILNAYHPYGPYFVTDYLGEHGTAKTTAARFHRQLIDPNQNPLRSPPREENDLFAQAVNNRCVALDNLSYLPLWLSDALCRVATGGGLSKRVLYTDTDELSLEIKRPVIINGIEDVATRPDLADRVLQIELETIPKENRITEKVLRQKFGKAYPVIFTAILDAVSLALRTLPTLKMPPLPRMADATEWATAGETGFGFKRGTFLKVYQRNLDESAEVAVEASLVGEVIRKLLEKWERWEGTPRELLDVLNGMATEKVQGRKDWPESPQRLGLILRRIAPALRRAGIGYERQKGGARTIWLTRAPKKRTKSAPGSDDDADSPNLHVVS